MVRQQVTISAPIDAGLIYLRGVQVNGSPYAYDNTITEDFMREHRGRNTADVFRYDDSAQDSAKRWVKVQP